MNCIGPVSVDGAIQSNVTEDLSVRLVCVTVPCRGINGIDTKLSLYKKIKNAARF